MHVLPVRTCAVRMAILLCAVVAVDIAASFLTAKPQLSCAVIPALIPILTPAAILSNRVPSKN
jgi:hypothetical protein